MKKKINVAEILRNCPKGMELYSPIYGLGILTKVTDRIHVKFPKEHNVKCFRCDGKVSDDGEIMLFPKGKTTWEGFVPPCNFKDGDIVITYLDHIAIVSHKECGEIYYTYCVAYEFGAFTTANTRICPKRLATEKERQKLFDVIKANGYKWDEGAKTLKKSIVPKFKVGDRIVHKRGGRSFTITEITGDFYQGGTRYALLISQQDNFELAPDKFDINILNAFDKVLVRDTNEQVWVADFFSQKVEKQSGGYTFACVGHYTDQCIPYYPNEHLLGTTDTCDEYYKNWK